jgi:hypothetical protein
MKETVSDYTKKITYIDGDFIRQLGPSLIESLQLNLFKTEFQRTKVLFHVKYLCFMLVYTAAQFFFGVSG